MRTTRLHQVKLAAVLLCAIAAGDVLAQAAKPAAPAAAPAAAKPSTGFLPPAASSAKVIDSVYVIVNDEVITRREVDNRVAEITARLRAQNAQLPDPEDLRRQVVEAMIAERAQLQLGKEYGIRVSDLELDRAIGRIAESQKMSVQEMRNQMEKEGMTFAQFREQIRNEIVMQRLIDHEVDAKIQVSDAEIDTYLAAEKAAAADRVEMDIAQILVRIPENASPEQIAARKARAEEVARQLRTGADFAKMAATYSDAPDALQGGAIGWRDPDRLPQTFASELRKLKPGQVTPVLRTNFGFLILKLANERKPEAQQQQQEQAAVQQTHARHIMLKLSPTQTEEEDRKKLLDFKAKIESKQATFEDLARQNSQDSFASKGGDMGWIESGDVPAEFESAMKSLQPGQISDPVKTPFGMHIIQVVERKSQDTSKDKERATARQVLTERKRQEALEDWTRQIRDRAYVEFREDK
ncbi:molecular chaperone SurA [Massilia sp. WF1]|uniref:peptidylprolyl isomerase n=1 Tax=unclassified Massilia TaxID=2609279 RepID=UPI00064A7A88|nr:MULTISPECIES: peptidylprolyl isomerase [unclassified Massilia]ALK99123.1 molecular chaperone SurA [Massilia sp. WG5]KLU35159.1 molecular chaperone SurA [Massilia sp. WF1]